MAQNINSIVDAEGSVIGSITAGPCDEGETKKGSTWLDWDVSLEDGRNGRLRTFGDRGNGEARANIGERMEFYNNNGFTNMKKASGVSKPPAQEHKKQVDKPVETKKEVNPDVWARKDREKVRGFALSYAKDLAIAEIIKLDDIAKVAGDFCQFISHSPSLSAESSAADDDWIDKKPDKTYPDGRAYGEDMVISATSAQAGSLLSGIRSLCTNGAGEADLSMGVDILNGMLCKFYFDDDPSSLDIKGPVSKETVKAAIMREDSLTIQYFINELEGKK